MGKVYDPFLCMFVDKCAAKKKARDASMLQKYMNAIRDEDYATASKLFRQAEQEDERVMSDSDLDKLEAFFIKKFGKRPK